MPLPVGRAILFHGDDGIFPHRFGHPAEISDTMAELKKYGKTMQSSVMVRERRTPGQPPELVATGAEHSRRPPGSGGGS